MNVLALDFSPTPKEFSLTHMLLTRFVKGMILAGANVEIIKFSKTDNNVDPCVGCLHCWTVTPGECKTIKDDMSTSVFAKWQNADLVVYATPIYNQFMTASMKSFIERLQPAGDIANFRGQSKANYPDTVLLATATYHGKEEFSFLSSYMNGYYAKEKNSRILVELYRPQVKFLSTDLFPKFKSRILSAYEKAGQELIETGSVSPETIDNATCDLTDMERFNRLQLLISRTIQKHNMSHKVFIRKKPPLDVTNIDDFIMLSGLLMENMNIPKKALDDFKIQMNFVEGNCSTVISNDSIKVSKGIVKNPNIQVATNIATWMSIMGGKISFQEAVEQQDINIEFKDENSRHIFLNLMRTMAPNIRVEKGVRT